MVAIDNYKSKVNISHEPTAYLKSSANPDAFGVNTAKALQELGETSTRFTVTMAGLYKDVQQINAQALSNYIDELERTDLTDPQNGYYSKLGKDAMANPDDPNSGAAGIMSNIEKKVNQKQQELGLSWGYGNMLAENLKAKKYKMLYNGATAHELEQTKAWGIATIKEASNLAINKGIIHRDNDADIETALGNGRASIINLARTQRWDNETAKIQLAKFTSDFHSGILNAYLQDGSLKASEYYDKHKDELLPEAQNRLLGQVKNNELNYTARSVSERLFNLYPEDETGAYAEVDKMENENERNAVENRLTALYSRKRRLDNQEQDQLMDSMWENVAAKLKNGQMPSEDDIPYGLNGKNWYQAQNAINQLVNKGDIDTDNSAYLELYELRNTDAQRFANMNLTQYRSVLSNADYKAFQKMQIDIKNMTPTQLADQDKAIKDGLKALGYTYNKQGELNTDPSWFIGEKTEKKAEAFKNAANAYIRELELKKGKNLTQGEISDAMQEFSQNYSYKDKKGKASDLYIEGMNKQVGFMRNVLNDFQAAQKAKGAPLTDEEKYTIVAERVSKTTQEDNKELSTSIGGVQQAQVGDTWFGHRITSVYGNRTRPTKGASTDHKGVDLAYNPNEPIEAFASGKVVKVANDPKGYGNYVDIQSADGTIHRYAHANSISVSKGQEITAGQRIGRAGATGVATGAHLHYEKIVNGVSVDPLKQTAAKSNTTPIAEGTIIRNSKTGQRLIMRNGKWQTL